MNKFKAGDKVRYVKAGAIGWESADWAAEAGLILGEEYTIRYSQEEDDDPSVFIEEDYQKYFIHPDHFELIEGSDIKAELIAALEAIDDMLDEDVLDLALMSEIIHKVIAKAKGEQHE